MTACPQHLPAPWLRRILAGLCLLAALGARAAAPPPAVAVVTDLAGHAQLRRGGVQRPLVALDTLRAQDQLRLDAGAMAEIAFTAGTGSVLRLGGPGRFLVRAQDVLPRDRSGVAERRDLAAAWRGVQIRPGLVGRASIALRGLPATGVQLRAPIGAQVGDDLVRLQWDPPYGRPSAGWEYAVRVIDDQGTLLYAAQARAPGIDLPADLPIERGRDYLWTVQAQADGRRHVHGAAEFRRVPLEVEQRAQALVASVRAQRRDPAQPESSAEEVLLALVLDQAGLRQAAQRQWQGVARVRPALDAAAVPGW